MIIFCKKKTLPYICAPIEKSRVGQSVKTPPFHGGMTSSTLVRGTKKHEAPVGAFVFLIAEEIA